MSSITLWGAVYDTDYVDLPKTGGGTARFSEGGGGGLQTENIIPEQTINCTISIGSAYAGFISQYSVLPQNGEYYLVTLDGVEYVARAFNRSEGSLVLGDVRIQQGTAFVEFPFEIISESYFYIAVGTNGAHTLKVDRILSWN